MDSDVCEVEEFNENITLECKNGGYFVKDRDLYRFGYLGD
jgi:hypothetical protein